MRKLAIGACTNRSKIEQLEAVLEQKKKELAKHEKINKVLTEREKVFSRCISQQVDLLQVLGQLTFTLPEPDDAAYEAKATAAAEALLVDMQVAQLMQAAGSISTSATTSEDVSSDTHASQLQRSSQQQLQQEQDTHQHQGMQQDQATQQQDQAQQQQQQHGQQQCFTVATLRGFLQSPDCMATLRRMGSASVEELAGIIKDQTMKLGFAVARYPSKTYMGAAVLAAAEDEQRRQAMQAANARLHAALNALGTTNLLLHIVGDKVLKLSTLNLESLQPETPPASFWEDVASQLDLPQPHMAQLHTGFLIYNSKRSELTSQMQQTMAELQQLLVPLSAEASQHTEQRQQQHQQQQATNSHLPSNSSSSSSSATTHADQGDHGHDSRLEDPPDVLSSLAAADQLLQQLSRQVRSLREASRCLIFLFCNVLDPLQLSLAAVHAWPFILQPPPVVEVMVKQQVAKQQQEEGLTTDNDDK